MVVMGRSYGCEEWRFLLRLVASWIGETIPLYGMRQNLGRGNPKNMGLRLKSVCVVYARLGAFSLLFNHGEIM